VAFSFWNGWYGNCVRRSENSKTAKREDDQMWQGWITGTLGIWLIIASFVFNGNVFNELAVGVTVAVMGFSAAVK